MIKIENTEVVGWEAAVRGMRNPMNSWDKSDSGYVCGDKKCSAIPGCDICCDVPHYVIGPRDISLMKKLANAGTDHRKFMRMITVYFDITAPSNIYKSRRNHKLDEWHTLCDWIESLPYSELITGKDFFSNERV